MRVILNCGDTRLNTAWSFFNKNGEVIPLTDMEEFSSKYGPTRNGRVIELDCGTYWLLCINPYGVSVRSYILTNTYPLGSRETLETEITTGFALPYHRDAKWFRQYLETETKKTEKTYLQYPQTLIDAICVAVQATEKQR